MEGLRLRSHIAYENRKGCMPASLAVFRVSPDVTYIMFLARMYGICQFRRVRNTYIVALRHLAP
jgi:hypothetical protein